MTTFRCIGCKREGTEAGWMFVQLPENKGEAHEICPQCFKDAGAPRELDPLFDLARKLLKKTALFRPGENTTDPAPPRRDKL